MGCDIHEYLERKKGNGEWSCVEEHCNNLCRNYSFFSLLAGVRMDEHSRGEHLEPKGFPEDACIDAKKHYYFDLELAEPNWGYYAPSWVTTEELEWVVKQYCRGESADGCDFYDLLQVMKKYEANGYDCRLVFWFDN